MIKYISTAIINVLQVFKKKKMEESMSLLRKSTGDKKKTQMELLKLKNYVWGEKYTGWD